MLAVVKERPGPGLAVAECPEPGVDDHDVLIEVRASGICGTDLAIKKWMAWAAEIIGDGLPVIVGHEFGGNVIDTGKSVRRFKKGDRVVAEPFITCGVCYFCGLGRPNLCRKRYYLGMNRNGGMAAYASAPETVLYHLPESIPDHVIPVLETLATCVHPVERLAVCPGDTVAIVGPGPIGLCLLQVAKAAGATTVVVVGTAKSGHRLQTAETLGADETIITDNGNVIEQILVGTSGLGVDAAFDTTGTEAGIMTALGAVRRGGSVCLVGVSDDPVPIKPFSQLMMKEVNMISSLARLPSSWYRAIRLVETGKVNLEPLIGDRIPLKDGLKGFEMAENREAVKIVLQP